MTKPPISRETLALSQRRYARSMGSKWRYMEFFNFLQISPSYRLAHLVATGKIDRSTAVFPNDFALVETTYSAFGDVSRTYFWEWWFTTAQYEFRESLPPTPRTILKLDLDQHATDEVISSAQAALADYVKVDRMAQGSSATLVIALPLHADRKSMLQNLNKLLDQAYAEGDRSIAIARWEIIRNKMRKSMIDKARQVLRSRASYPDEPLVRIGERTKVSPKNAVDSHEKGKGAADAKRLLQILTSRHLNRAYLLAENAARGRFPSLDPLPADRGRPQFDYKVLNKELMAHGRWLMEELERLNEINERQEAQRLARRARRQTS